MTLITFMLVMNLLAQIKALIYSGLTSTPSHSG